MVTPQLCAAPCKTHTLPPLLPPATIAVNRTTQQARRHRHTACHTAACTPSPCAVTARAHCTDTKPIMATTCVASCCAPTPAATSHRWRVRGTKIPLHTHATATAATAAGVSRCSCAACATCPCVPVASAHFLCATHMLVSPPITHCCRLTCGGVGLDSHLEQPQPTSVALSPASLREANVGMEAATQRHGATLPAATRDDHEASEIAAEAAKLET